MARVHILKSRAKDSFLTLEFVTYNEALAYAKKAGALAPSRPYKRIKAVSAPTWCVTMRQPRNDRATYVTFPSVPDYLGWKLVA